MKRILVFLFSTYFLIGAIILPQSDFSLSTNLSTIYDDFIVLNGNTSFANFLDEQFIESFELFDNENTTENPHEKDQKPVPIHYYLTQASSMFKVQIPDLDFSEPTPVIEFTTFYQNFYLSITPGYIFHPPKAIA